MSERPLIQFDDAIDYWLQRRARKNQDSGASKVMVVCDESKHVRAVLADR